MLLQWEYLSESALMAIAIPAFLFCLSVSETTKVNNGPGEIPAANPKTAPDRRNSNGSIIMVLFRRILS